MKAPQSESLETAATVAYFDTEAAGWSVRYEANRHFRARLQTVLGWLDDRTVAADHAEGGLNLLDYGCGSGVLMRELLRRGHAVTGVDVSGRMLAAACDQLTPLGKSFRLQRVPSDVAGASVDGVSAANGVAMEDAGANDAPDWHLETYDGVFCLGVIEYVEAPEALLALLAAVIRPGGFLVLSWPNAQSLLRRIERWVFAHPGPFLALGLFPHLTGPDSYLHFQRQCFSQESLNRLLADHGLVQRRVRPHVAPKILGPLQHHPALGMSVISEFTKFNPL